MNGITRILTSLLLLAIGAPPAPAQQIAGAKEEPEIRAYIRRGWDGLSRSMTECASLVDPKVRTKPVLYLPYGRSAPPAVLALRKTCGVQVERLPRRIRKLGDVAVQELPAEGLLYLPNRYVVPGGRFNEMYGWDSYFIVLGLLEDGRDDLARGMVENFLFEIENYGALLNANRTYFFTRSQPPLLSSMVREVYEHQAARPLARAWLERAYSMSVRDHALWTSEVHRAGETGLARYHDIGTGPVPEMADDSEYYPDVIRWFLAHPDRSAGYLIDAPDTPTEVQVAEMAKTSCDIRLSKVCERAHVNGHRLTAAFYEGDRAMRESGFDTTFRFGPFSGSTQNMAPVCLNSLLFKYETDLAYFAQRLGRTAEAAQWKVMAEERHAAVDRLLWSEKKGFYYDFDFIAGKQTNYNYLSAFYPLWAGMASRHQADAVEKHLAVFEHEGGLAMSDVNSGTQWDLPYGWAPSNWIAVDGLERYGFHNDAERVAKKFSATVLQTFQHDSTVREKYNVVNGTANVEVAAGYKSNVIGFGWTNGVYLRMQRLLAVGR